MIQEGRNHTHQWNPGVILDSTGQEVPDYESGFFPIAARYSSTEDTQSFDIPAHWHENLEIVHLLRGENVYLVSGVACPMKGDSLIFVKPGAIHSVRNSESYEAEVILMDTRLLRGHELFIQKYLTVFENCEQDFFFFDHQNPCYSSLSHAFQELYFSCRNQPEAYELKAMSSVYRLLWIICTNIASDDIRHFKGAVRDNTLQILKQMMRYTEEHFSESISVGDLAEAACISRSSCEKMFRKVLHLSPVDYMIQVRLLKSKELLNKGLSVTQAALDSGFNSLSYFSRVFKNINGMTPIEYQKKATHDEKTIHKTAEGNIKRR